MIEFPKFYHTAIITGSTGCGKTYFVMNLLLNEYLNYFQIVIVICPTFEDNDTYIEYRYLFNRRKIDDDETHFYFWSDKEPPLEKCIEEFSKMFKGFSILFIIDDMASNSSIVKKRTPLSTLAISGRHTKRSLWVLTQKYNSIGNDVREQAKWVCSFYCKDKTPPRKVEMISVLNGEILKFIYILLVITSNIFILYLYITSNY